MISFCVFLAGLSATPYPLPPMPTPRIVVSESPYEWILIYLPALVSFVQFIFLFFLTVITFRSNARQKVAERQASWYHKVVVDHSVESITQFVASNIAGLELLVPYRESTGYRAEVRDGLAQFKAKLSELLDDITRRLDCFPRSPCVSVAMSGLRIEDEVTGWFDSPSSVTPNVRRVLNAFQSDILAALRSYEFEEWGWPRRSWIGQHKRDSISVG